MLDTARLRLQPNDPRDLLALIEGDEAYRERTGLTAAEGLRDFFVSGEVSANWLEQLRQASSPDPWQFGFAVVERDSGVVVGTGGFKGPPDEDGVVEVAYGIVPDREGRGYATEVATSLFRFAVDHGGVKVVRAHTLPENNASGKVLTKAGFQKRGEVIDPEDGLVWRWERPV